MAEETDLSLEPALVLPRPFVSDPASSQPNFVVFYNGTFAPIHQGHIDVAIKAVEHLARRGRVAGLYFSPAAPHYAAGKLKTARIALIHRMRMVELALEETRQRRRALKVCAEDPFDAVAVDTWEWSQGFYVNLYATMDAFKRRVQRVPELQGHKIQLVWLTGIDLCPGYPLPDFDLLCVDNRGSQFAERGKAMFSKAQDPRLKKHFDLISAPADREYSSTEVRKVAQSGRNPAEALGLISVGDYMAQHLIYSVLDGTRTPSSPFEEEMVAGMVLFLRKGQTTDFNPSWLTHIFRRCGKLDETVEVASVDTVKRIGQGLGFNSMLIAVTGIHFINSTSKEPVDSSLTKAPRSVVVKLGASDHIRGSSAPENEFFLRIAPTSFQTLRIPECYFASTPSTTRDKTMNRLLVMENLADAKSARFRKGFDRDELLAIAKSFAAFHAQWWNHPLLETTEFTWLPRIDDPLFKKSKLVRYASINWAQNLAQIRKLAHSDPFASPERKELVEWIATAMVDGKLFVATLEALGAMQGQSVCHGDAWVNNILFRDRPVDTDLLIGGQKPPSLKLVDKMTVHKCGETVKEAWFVDWENCLRGPPLIDIAFAFYNSTAPEVLAECEEEVLEVYYNSLCFCGVDKETKLPPKRFRQIWELSKYWAFFHTLVCGGEFFFADQPLPPFWTRIFNNLIHLDLSTAKLLISPHLVLEESAVPPGAEAPSAQAAVPENNQCTTI